ncbi:MAG: hypothetical protein WDN29_06405 [Methylovirgula sp.]
MNVIGQPVDEAGPINTTARRSIHQPAPSYADQSTEAQILETASRSSICSRPTPEAARSVFSAAPASARPY